MWSGHNSWRWPTRFCEGARRNQLSIQKVNGKFCPPPRRKFQRWQAFGGQFHSDGSGFCFQAGQGRPESPYDRRLPKFHLSRSPWPCSLCLSRFPWTCAQPWRAAGKSSHHVFCDLRPFVRRSGRFCLLTALRCEAWTFRGACASLKALSLWHSNLGYLHARASCLL